MSTQNQELILNLINLLINNDSNSNKTKQNDNSEPTEDICSDFIGKYCIIRTYSAGVFAGYLEKKAGNEVIIKDSRRLFYWVTKNGGLSLSEVANEGLKDSSKVCQPESYKWTEAVEIIPTTKIAEQNIKNQKNYIG